MSDRARVSSVSDSPYTSSRDEDTGILSFASSSPMPPNQRLSVERGAFPTATRFHHGNQSIGRARTLHLQVEDERVRAVCIFYRSPFLSPYSRTFK